MQTYLAHYKEFICTVVWRSHVAEVAQAYPAVTWLIMLVTATFEAFILHHTMEVPMANCTITGIT